jgi:hypothetical protein
MAKTDVVKSNEGDQVPAALLKDMEADAKVHTQAFAPDQLVIPRLTILQDLSPQLKERKAEYVPGAKVGDIYNNVTNTLDRSIKFTPSKFDVQYIAWAENRGGLIDPNLTKEEVEENFEPDGIGAWRGMIVPRNKQNAVAVEVIETPTWVGMARGEGWGPMPVAIAFPVTKAKSARKMNTAIDMAEIEGANGPFKPPAFYHQFTLSTAIEQSGENEWFGWAVSHDGIGLDERMIAKAKELKISFDKGDATISEEGAER